MSSEEMLLDRAEGGGADPTRMVKKVQALKVGENPRAGRSSRIHKPTHREKQRECPWQGRDAQAFPPSPSPSPLPLLLPHVCLPDPQVPPLPPDLGSLCQPNGQPFSYYVQPVTAIDDAGGAGSTTTSSSSSSQKQQQQQQGGWRPKEGVLVGTLPEHSRAVNRLAVAQVGGWVVGGTW